MSDFHVFWLVMPSVNLHMSGCGIVCFFSCIFRVCSLFLKASWIFKSSLQHSESERPIAVWKSFVSRVTPFTPYVCLISMCSDWSLIQWACAYNTHVQHQGSWTPQCSSYYIVPVAHVLREYISTINITVQTQHELTWLQFPGSQAKAHHSQ